MKEKEKKDGEEELRQAYTIAFCYVHATLTLHLIIDGV
jgi:hypothetical protein